MLAIKYEESTMKRKAQSVSNRHAMAKEGGKKQKREKERNEESYTP